MAEAIASIGLLGTAVQLVDACVKVGKCFKDISENVDNAPHMFKHMQLQARAIQQILNHFQQDRALQTQVQADNDSINDLIENSQVIANRIPESISGLISAAEDKRRHKFRKACKALIQDKKIEQSHSQLLRNCEILHVWYLMMPKELLVPKNTLPDIIVTCDTQQRSDPFGSPHGSQDTQQLHGISCDLKEQVHQKILERKHSPDLRKSLTPYRATRTISRSRIKTCSCSYSLQSPTNNKFWNLRVVSSHAADCPMYQYSLKGSFWIPPTLLTSAIHIEVDLHRAACGKRAFGFQSRVVNTVPMTSPGFVLTTILQYKMEVWPSVREEILRLMEKGYISLDDVDRDGQGILDRICKLPWGGWKCQHIQFELLKLIIPYMKAYDEGKLLLRCLSWIGEGAHYQLVKLLLELEIDFSQIDEIDLVQWPKGCNPDWLTEECVADPFYIEVIKMIHDENLGFGNLPPLHLAVLARNMQQIQAYQAKSTNKSARNFLGQTVLHLAISYPGTIALLLSDVEMCNLKDMGDRHGTTPLMYAATYNSVESAICLLNAGANPLIQDELNHRTFIHYAVARKHIEFLIAIAKWYESQYAKDSLNAINAWMSTIIFLIVLRNSPMFLLTDVPLRQNLFEVIPEPTFSQSYHDNLLHNVKNIDDCRILLERDGWNLNQSDEKGTTAFMKVVAIGDPQSIARCISLGADTTLRDYNGVGPLAYLPYYGVLRSFSLSHADDFERFDDFMCCLRLLVNTGSDFFEHDLCLCACSGGGCNIMSKILGSWNTGLWNHTRHIIVTQVVMEILSTLDEGNSSSGIISWLDQYRRCKRFAELEISHVCCSLSDHFLIYLAPKCKFDLEETMEILDEEKEMITQLENSLAKHASTRPLAILPECYSIIVEHTIVAEQQGRKAAQQSLEANRSIYHNQKASKVNTQPNLRPSFRELCDSPITKFEIGSGCTLKIDKTKDIMTWDSTTVIYGPGFESYDHTEQPFTVTLDAYKKWVEYSWERKQYEKVGIDRPESWRTRRLAMVDALRAEYEVQLQKQAQEDVGGLI